MFLINVQIDLCLHFPVDVWPYARVLACECNEVIVELCAQTEVFFVFGRTLLSSSLGAKQFVY